MLTREDSLRTAWLNLRHSPPERWALFETGLRRLGYAIRHGYSPAPADGDLLVTWNRMPNVDPHCARYRHVLVVENGSWGKHLADEHWLTIARDHHNTAGRFPIGGWERWDTLGVELAPWRAPRFEDGGARPVVLAQRSIGSAPTAMPVGWANRAASRHGARIRRHPGNRPEALPLEQDLINVRGVVTWGSAAAVQALIWGIPVVSEMPNWIGQQDNTDAGRLNMLRTMAWAQWRPHEIERGEPFVRLLT